MTPPLPIEALQQQLDEACARWRSMPDGHRFHALTYQLGLFVHAVVAEAIQDGKAQLTASIPGLGKVMIRIAVTNGKATIINHRYVTDLDEVVGEYLIRRCQQYLDHPDVGHVRSAAYVRMGIVQTAYTLERRWANLRKKEILTAEPDSRTMETRAPGKGRPPMDADRPATSIHYLRERYDEPGGDAYLMTDTADDTRVFQRLKTLWFFPDLQKAAPEGLLKSFSGLSLRYLYVVLRYNSGAALTEIAGELGIHSSRLTELKREYTGLFTTIQSTAWLSLERDFKPVRVEDRLLHRMNLKGVHCRYSLLKAAMTPHFREDTLRSKRILWRLFRLGVALAQKGDDGVSSEVRLIVPDSERRPDIEITVRQDRESLTLSDFSVLTAK